MRAMRRPAINPHDGRILVDVPLDDRPMREGHFRRIVLSETVIAAYLRIPVEQIGARNFERFAHNNLDRICQRAIDEHNAGSTVHLRQIDDPRAPGVPDLIMLKQL